MISCKANFWLKTTGLGHYTLHVLVQPLDEVPPGLFDIRLVFRGTVFSLPMHKPVSLSRKCFNLILDFAVFLQLLGQLRDLGWEDGRTCDPQDCSRSPCETLQ